MSLMAPDEARRRILAAATRMTGTEAVALPQALGRTLASDLAAMRTQPPFAASAMDGYAVRAAELVVGQPLNLIGEAAAGHPFVGKLGAGEAVRIFTGAVVPDGADTILIQENASRIDERRIVPTQTEAKGRFVRPAGLDFSEGAVLLEAGTVLDARRIGLAASMGHATLPVRRPPRVAILSTGDELALPGEALKSGQIVSSNAFALAAQVTAAGAEAIDLGIVPDTAAATRHAIEEASGIADIILTSGGASVGDHDFVQGALTATGFAMGFWKVAVRPGKPLMFGTRGEVLCIGLPGNPVSSLVCALLFVVPLIGKLMGRAGHTASPREPALLGRHLPANDLREEYMRASLHRSDAGLIATPFASQDSSIQRLLVEAGALVVRPAHAPAARAGDACEIIRL
jgi:molybdopterin molybdotransferase